MRTTIHAATLTTARLAPTTGTTAGQQDHQCVHNALYDAICMKCESVCITKIFGPYIGS